MSKTRLLKQWRITRSHLTRAREFLAAWPVENLGDLPDQDRASLASYDGFLEHNELELALDQLEGLGELNSPPDGFWRALQDAANLMQLHGRAAQFESPYDEALRAKVGPQS